MEAFHPGSLLSFLAAVPDPRSRHGRQHPLSAILACVLRHHVRRKSYAAIGQWAQDHDITLMHRLGFTRRPPKSGGIRKVLIALNPKAFEDALTSWVESLLGRPFRRRSRRHRKPMLWMASQPVAASTASRKPCTCSRLWLTNRG